MTEGDYLRGRGARGWRARGRRLRASLCLRSGQVFPLVAIMLTGVIGVSAYVIDVGSWYRDHRSMQAIADASALAGAQDLPYDQSGATALAQSYASKNGGPTPLISFPTSNTIDVVIVHQAPGYLAPVSGTANQSVTIQAEAHATAALVTQAAGVAPIIVTDTEPNLTGCSGAPCFGVTVTLKVNDDTSGGGGQTGLIDLRANGNGSVTAQQIADWVTNGLSTPIPANYYYYSAGSCKFSNQNFHSALDAKVAAATPLLFPVYDPLRTDSSTNPPRFWIVGWAAMVVTSYRLNGCGNKSDFIKGYFVHDIVDGTSDGTPTADYGVRVITLSNS
jgi:Flp pilus assembly protein TadG